MMDGILGMVAVPSAGRRKDIGSHHLLASYVVLPSFSTHGDLAQPKTPR